MKLSRSMEKYHKVVTLTHCGFESFWILCLRYIGYYWSLSIWKLDQILDIFVLNLYFKYVIHQSLNREAEGGLGDILKWVNIDVHWYSDKIYMTNRLMPFWTLLSWPCFELQCIPMFRLEFHNIMIRECLLCEVLMQNQNCFLTLLYDILQVRTGPHEEIICTLRKTMMLTLRNPHCKSMYGTLQVKAPTLGSKELPTTWTMWHNFIY